MEKFLKLRTLLKPVSFKTLLPGFWDKPLIGIDLGSYAIKVLQFKDKEGTLQSVGIYNLPGESLTAKDKREYLVSGISILMEQLKLKQKEVAICLSSKNVVTKRIEVEIPPKGELHSIILSEAERYIPYNLEDVNLSYTILSEKENKQEVIIAAAKKETIAEYIDMLREANLTPVVIDVEDFALANAFEACYGITEEAVLVIDMGATKLNIVGLSKGIPIFTREVATGGIDFTKEIQNKFGVSFSEAERIKIEGVEEKNEKDQLQEIFLQITTRWFHEIKTAIDFLENITGKEVNTVYLCGGSSRIVGLAKALAKFLAKKVYMFNTGNKIKYDQNRFDPKYLDYLSPQLPIALGLGLRTKADR